MSGASINKKIQSAMQKIGNILGSNFKVYRSVNYLDPIKPQNYISDVVMAFSVDTAFDAPQDSSFKQLNLFVDPTNLMVGDILVNDSKTITVVSKEPLQRCQGIDSTHTITVSRPSYSTSGSFGVSTVLVASNIPAALHSVSAKPEKGPMGESNKSSGATQYNIWIWLPENTIKIGDLVEDNFGSKSKIDSIEFTPVGYKLTTNAPKAT